MNTWAALNALPSKLIVRADGILTEHLAWMPSLMPPPDMPLTQYFGGQVKVMNAGTLAALERKGKVQRPAAPKP